MQNKKAFTLAEILLTLLIIGIIATLTIPQLLLSMQNDQIVVGIQKSYLKICDATKLIGIDKSGTLDGVFSSNDSFMNEYATQIAFSKICLQGQNMGHCWHESDKVWDLHNDLFSLGNPDYDATYPRAITNDGMLMLFNLKSSSCTNNDVVIDGESVSCGYILVDVNGFKAPNMLGRDIFGINVLRNGNAVLWGSNKSDVALNQSCDKTVSDWGWQGKSCAAKISKEGWKIKY